MKKTIFIFILFLSYEVLLSQEQERPNYFPLAIGNKWEYMGLVAHHRVVMEITKDTVMSNGKQYYIFEYTSPRELFYNYFYLSKYFFTPLDPVRMDENGDIYAYDDSTQNEYLYLKFSEGGGHYQVYGTLLSVGSGEWRGPIDVPRRWVISSHYTRDDFFFRNNVGMMRTENNFADCWGTIWDPCPPFWNQSNILVYAIIDGEKVYSIEDCDEEKSFDRDDCWKYLRYISINDVNLTGTYPQQVQLHQTTQTHLTLKHALILRYQKPKK